MPKTLGNVPYLKTMNNDFFSLVFDIFSSLYFIINIFSLFKKCPKLLANSTIQKILLKILR